MAAQSVFEKRHVDASELSDVEGLLEHFNLPPNVIAYMRENKRIIQIGIALVIIAVVSWSLYGSYHKKRIEQGASALALALKEPSASQKAALENVANEYSNSSSGTWAEVELAHLDMKLKNYAEAATRYSAVNKEMKKENPLFALTLFGLAQAYEAQSSFDEAYAVYGELKNITGYQLTGYTAMARIHEAKGENEKALGIYGQYLTLLGENESDARIINTVKEKIARIKTKQ